MPTPNPLKSPKLFLRFWLDAFKEAFGKGWAMSGIASAVIPDLLVVIGKAPLLAQVEFFKWMHNNQNLARLYCVAAVVLAYLIYAPYRKYKETQIQCFQSMKRAWDRMNVIGEENTKLKAQLDEQRRPKLILSEESVVLNSEGQVCFSFLVKNVGPGTATNTNFTFLIQTTRLSIKPAIREATNQPISEQTARRVTYSFPTISPDPAYMMLYMSYTGEDLKKWEHHPVFLGWNGVKNGAPSPILNYISIEEIATFMEYLRKHEIPEPVLQALNSAPAIA